MSKGGCSLGIFNRDVFQYTHPASVEKFVKCYEEDTMTKKILRCSLADKLKLRLLATIDVDLPSIFKSNSEIITNEYKKKYTREFTDFLLTGNLIDIFKLSTIPESEKVWALDKRCLNSTEYIELWKNILLIPEQPVLFKKIIFNSKIVMCKTQFRDTFVVGKLVLSGSPLPKSYVKILFDYEIPLHRKSSTELYSDDQMAIIMKRIQDKIPK